MKRVKLINDPAELVALFRAVDSEVRRNVLSTLAEGWTINKNIGASVELEKTEVLLQTAAKKAKVDHFQLRKKFGRVYLL